jgi:hypothetical protein
VPFGVVLAWQLEGRWLCKHGMFRMHLIRCEINCSQGLTALLVKSLFNLVTHMSMKWPTTVGNFINKVLVGLTE